MSQTVTVTGTEKFTVYDKSGQQIISFNHILQVLAGFGNWKKTGNTKPL